MAGKWVAQAVFAGFNVMGRAFVQSYQRVGVAMSAKKRAQMASGETETEEEVKEKFKEQLFHTREMSGLEARKIVELPDVKDEAGMDAGQLGRMYWDRANTLSAANAPGLGGSAYVQAKVVEARNTLDAEWRSLYGISLVGEFTDLDKLSKLQNQQSTQEQKEKEEQLQADLDRTAADMAAKGGAAAAAGWRPKPKKQKQQQQEQ